MSSALVVFQRAVKTGAPKEDKSKGTEKQRLKEYSDKVNLEMKGSTLKKWQIEKISPQLKRTPENNIPKLPIR